MESRLEIELIYKIDDSVAHSFIFDLFMRMTFQDFILNRKLHPFYNREL